MLSPILIVAVAACLVAVYVLTRRHTPQGPPSPAPAPKERDATRHDPPSRELSPAAAPAPAPPRTPAAPAVPPPPPSSASDLTEDEPTGPYALILVTAVGRTDPGLRRTHNEDAYAILEDQQLFVIADGMGKHAAGEVASQLCVEAITEAFRTKALAFPATPPLPRRAARLRSAILGANAKVLSAAQETDAYTGMGTTVVTAYFSPNNQRAYIAHVGDSRCYRLRDDELVQLTMDHTLGAAGITGKSSALLSRAVGVEEYVDVDMLTESPRPGDIYLLCSDGLSRMVSDVRIKETLQRETDLDLVTKTLIDSANELGGRDNITAILVRVDKAGLV